MRLNWSTTHPAARHAMLGLERAVEESGLETALLDLVRVRSSQINGCARCIDMHVKDARASGETDQRLDLVAAWREAPCYTARERAALAWCEALTLLSSSGAPDDVFAEVEAVFDPSEQVALSLAIVAINGWNRLNVGFRATVGDYVSRRTPVAVGS